MISTIFLNAALISFRLIPIFVVAPISSFRRVPMLVRIILTLTLALIMSASLTTSVSIDLIEKEYIRLFLSEMVIGASLAFSFHAASAAVHMMGQQIDLQIGFAAGAVFDPSTEQTTSPTGEVLTLGLLVSLISLNIHHDILIGFSKLLEVIPPGSMINWSEDWLKILGTQFSIGFIITSPVIVTLWFTDLALAYISRALPQAQIYFVGLPIKVGIGIVVLAWFMSQALEPFHTLLTQSLLSWNNMFTR